MNNKIIEVQEMLFKEMKRLDDDKNININNEKESKLEFERATQQYNMATGFIKSVNSNITIMQLAKRNDERYEDLMSKLGL